MPDYTNYITIGGRVAINKMLASDRLVLTRAVASSLVAAVPEELTSISPESHVAEQISAVPNGTYTEITAVFDCSTLASNYDLKMIGVYGKLNNEGEEILVYVSVPDPELQTSIRAMSPITFNFKLKASVSTGVLTVVVSDDYSCPISHLSDNVRHLLAQTNESDEEIVISTGTDNVFSDGQAFVFVPRTFIGGAASLFFAGTSYPLVTKNPAGSEVQNAFRPATPYGLVYMNGVFIHRQVYVASDVRLVDGILHYYDGSAWKSTQRAGDLVMRFKDDYPAGCLACDGSSYNKALYPELFAVIGYMYGGSGNNFNVPDARGRHPVCYGMFSWASRPWSVGATYGRENVSIELANIPNHSHDMNHVHAHERHIKNGEGGQSTASWGSAMPSAPVGAFMSSLYSEQTISTATTTQARDGNGNTILRTGSAGGGHVLDIIPPSICVKWFITTGRSLI